MLSYFIIEERLPIKQAYSYFLFIFSYCLEVCDVYLANRFDLRQL